MPREPFRVMFLQVSVILFSEGGGSASRGVCLQGRGSVSRGFVQNPPPPHEIVKQVVSILLESFLVYDWFG